MIRSPRSQPLPIVIVPGLVAVCALPWIWEVPSRQQAALVLAQLLVCSAGVVSGFVHGLRPVRTVFFAFLFSWLGVGPLYQLSHRQLAWGDTALLDSTERVTAALALTLLATFTALAAMLCVDARSTAPLSRSAVRRVEIRPFVPWSYLLTLVALSPYVIVANGGIGVFFTSRDERVDVLSAAGVSVASSGGALVGLLSLLPAALSVAAAHLFVLHSRVRSSQVGWRRIGLADLAGLVVAIGGMAIYANPLSQTRFISIAAFGSVALAALAPRSRRAGQRFAVLLAVAVLAVYPLSQVIGSTAEQRAVDPLTVFASQDFDGFQQVINSLIFVEDLGHSDGLYTVSALLFAVPRSLWTGKATPASIDVAAHRDYWFTNLSLPLHAELYIDVGVLGMLLIVALLGWVFARVDHAWVHTPGTLGAFVAPYLALTQLGVLRGPLGSLAPVWIPVLVLLIFGVRRVRSSAPVRPPTRAFDPGVELAGSVEMAPR